MRGRKKLSRVRKSAEGKWGTGDLSEEDSKLLEYVPDFLETAIRHPKIEVPSRKRQSKRKGRRGRDKA